MANEIFEIRVTTDALSSPPQSFSGSAGAVVEFFGVVREREGEEMLAGIDYEAHCEMAEHQMNLIAAEAGNRFGLERVVLHHRIGFVPAAEPSLFLRVTSGHRAEALDGARWIIEELKQRVPVWKHPRPVPGMSKVKP